MIETSRRRSRPRASATRLMKRAGGRSVQGYNAHVVASPEQVIIAAAPMVANAVDTLREAPIQEPIGSCSRTAATGTRLRSPTYASKAIDLLIPTGTAGAADRARSCPAKATKRDRSKRWSRDHSSAARTASSAAASPSGS
jgi:hypothetical protein